MTNNERWFARNEKKLANISIAIIFLALIRCISEFYRLEYIMQDQLSIADVKPFILGALVTAISAFVMVILNFYSKHKIIMIVAVITIILLLLIKKIYLLN